MVNLFQLLSQKTLGLRNKLKKLAKTEDEQGFKYDLPKNFLFPKNDLKRSY